MYHWHHFIKFSALQKTSGICVYQKYLHRTLPIYSLFFRRKVLRLAYKIHIFCPTEINEINRTENVNFVYQTVLLKCNLSNFDMLITFYFGVSSNLSQEKTPTAQILGKCLLQKIVLRKNMHKIPSVGLFCCNKFEETPK